MCKVASVKCVPKVRVLHCPDILGYETSKADVILNFGPLAEFVGSNAIDPTKTVFCITTSHDHIPKEVSLLLVSMDCLNVHLGYIHDTSKADIVGSEVCRLFWKQKCSPVKAGFRNVCVKKGDCCPPCPNKVCSYSWPC